MESSDILSRVRKELRHTGQEHVLTFLEELDAPDRLELLDQCSLVDFRKSMVDFYRSHQKAVKDSSTLRPFAKEEVLTDKDPVEAKNWASIGARLIQEGKVAIITLAGGQGTRLGSDMPKGMYDVGLPSHKSLFQLQAEQILRLKALTSTAPYWYLMTSKHTHEETIVFFEKNEYFGLERERVRFFMQGASICFEKNGKILMEAKNRIATAANGNGGLYKALEASKILAEMEKNGVEHIHVYCVDNILVKVGDPVFIGACHASGAETGLKVVERINVDEQVGIVCKDGFSCRVLEYSEIENSVWYERDTDGHLLYRYANIANHYFSVGFLKKRASEIRNGMRFHAALKKIPYVNEKGTLVYPETKNGLKMELFIFDGIIYATRVAVFLVNREEEFSCLKNKTGADTPETCRRAFFRRSMKYLQGSGFPEGSEDAVCEISPLVSYCGEGLPDLRRKALSFPLVVSNISDLINTPK